MAVSLTPFALGAPLLYVDPVSQAGNVGSSASFGVRIDSATNISSFQFDLLYNPLLVSLSSQTSGVLFGDPFTFVPGSDDTNGTISAVADLLIGPGGISTTDGLLATFEFSLNTAGSASFSIANVLILDDQGSTITPDDPIGGTIRIEQGANVPEPSTFLLSATALAGLLALRRRK